MASQFTGIRNAFDYAYGIAATERGVVTPLKVLVGNQATGSQTITVDFGVCTTLDGRTFTPITTTTPITIGSGSNQETVTPTAVSNPTPAIYGTCQVTASFSNLHGNGDPIASGTFGLIEAVNDAHILGGLVGVDGRWVSAGGITGTITGNKGWTNVCVLDWRGTTGAVSYKAASNGVNMTATSNVLY